MSTEAVCASYSFVKNKLKNECILSDDDRYVFVIEGLRGTLSRTNHLRFSSIVLFCDKREKAVLLQVCAFPSLVS